MPDNIFKSDEIRDEGSGLTIQDLGPEEKIAQNVLESLKDKIARTRETIQELEDEIEEKKQKAESEREEILEDARNEAETIKQEAEEEAQDILNSREEEVEEAREDGYEEGYSDGERDAREEMAELVEQAQSTLVEAKRERDAFLDKKSDELVELAGLLAEEVVRETIRTDDGVIKRIVKDALDEISEVQSVTIVLNPEDAEVIEGVTKDFRENHPNLEEVTVSEDPKMKQGGCRIRTSFGDIQASVRNQINHLTETLIDDLDFDDVEPSSDDS